MRVKNMRVKKCQSRVCDIKKCESKIRILKYVCLKCEKKI